MGRVAIIAKHALFGALLLDIISADPELHVTGKYQTFEADVMSRLRPDVVVADLDVCGPDLSATFALWRGQVAGLKICVLSTSLDVHLLQRCLHASVDGFLMADIAPDELRKAIRIVASGGSYVDPRVAKTVLQQREAVEPIVNTLTIREREVLRLLARGATNKQIAGELGIMERTVKHHISNIFVKLNVAARSQAAVFAIRSGLVE